MNCPACGKIGIAEGASFCPECGAALPSVPQFTVQQEPLQQEASPQYTAPADEKPDKTKNILLVGALSSVAVVLLLIGIGITAFRHFRSTDAAEESTVAEAIETEVEAEEAIDGEAPADYGTATPYGTLPLAESIQMLNTNRTALPSINYDSIEYYPAARNTNAAWDSTLFYMLEDVDKNDPSDGLINSYEIVKKEFQNTSTGNMIEFNIYENPLTGTIHKIVTIEYADTRLWMNEYYYTDAGKINFIYSYTDTNYFPSYAMPTRDGMRYYFDNDVLAKWRVVENGAQTNFVVGRNSAAVGDNIGPVIDISELSPAQLAEYDAREAELINRAYLTLREAKEAEGVARIQGYVMNENAVGTANANVLLLDDETDEELYQTTTDTDGLYTIYVPSQTYCYRLRFVSTGCAEVELYDVETDEQSIGEYQTTVYLVPESIGECNESILIDDALNYNTNGSGMMPVADASYQIRRGVDCKTGAIVASGVADSSGRCYVLLPAGMYTVEITKTGYDTAYFILTVNGRDSEIRFHLSPTLPAGEVRIVLTWNNDPPDLDSHLFTPYCTAEEHISYYHREDNKGNNLDVDITSGYGPETVTIRSLETVGLYKYYVADFTDCSNGSYDSMRMSYSDAVVNVYSDQGLIGTFHVPIGQSGVIWEVFEIRNGVIVPSQRYYAAVEDKDWWGAKW